MQAMTHTKELNKKKNKKGDNGFELGHNTNITRVSFAIAELASF